VTFSNNSYSDSRRPKLLIADDHLLMLDGLQAVLQTQFDVLTVDNGQSFIERAEDFHPEIAVLDIGMPNSDGFVTAKKVLQNQPFLPIVFLSMYGDRSHVERAAEIGAKAFLSKCVPAEELIAALKAVLEGRTLLETPATSVRGEHDVKNGLTARQREVLRLIAGGCSAKDIANHLNISVRTAEFHRAAIMQRLSLHSTAQMTRYAIANNIA
jgi:DNA-binding NarL/FixJ family response regulator